MAVSLLNYSSSLDTLARQFFGVVWDSPHGQKSQTLPLEEILEVDSRAEIGSKIHSDDASGFPIHAYPFQWGGWPAYSALLLSRMPVSKRKKRREINPTHPNFP